MLSRTQKILTAAGAGLLLAVAAPAMAQEGVANRVTKTIDTSTSCDNPLEDNEIREGQEVYYCFYLENTGTVDLKYHTLRDLMDGTETDVFKNKPIVLVPGQGTWVHDGPHTIPANDQSSVTNTASLFSSPVSLPDQLPPPVTDPNIAQANFQVVVDKEPADVRVAKTASPSSNVEIGGDVTYTYTLRNIGGRVLDTLTLTDNKISGLPAIPGGDMNPGESETVTKTASVVPDGTTFRLTNTATFTGSNPTNQVAPVSDADSATVTFANGSITLQKTVGLVEDVCGTAVNLTVAKGASVYYCYTFTNNSPYSSYDFDYLKITDDVIGTVFDQNRVLKQGVTGQIVSNAYVADNSVTNRGTIMATGTVSGVDIDASASDTATVTALLPSISLSKTVGTSKDTACSGSSDLEVEEGDSVYYCYTVRNTSPASIFTLTSHTLTDSKLGNIPVEGCTLGTSAPYNMCKVLYGPVTINKDTQNSARWTASGTVTGVNVSASDSATAIVRIPVDLPPPQPVPAISSLGMAGLALFMGMAGGLRARRRRS